MTRMDDLGDRFGFCFCAPADGAIGVAPLMRVVDSSGWAITWHTSGAGRCDVFGVENSLGELSRITGHCPHKEYTVRLESGELVA